MTDEPGPITPPKIRRILWACSLAVLIFLSFTAGYVVAILRNPAYPGTSGGKLAGGAVFPEIARIADPSCTWAERRRLVNGLSNRDPAAVLEPLAQAIVATTPGFGGYPHVDSRDDDDWIAQNVRTSYQPHLAYTLAWREITSAKTPRVSSALRRLALSRADAEARAMAVSALLDYKSPETLDALRQLSKDPEATVRLRSVLGLSQYLPATSKDLLSVATADESPQCRHDALLRLLFDYDAPASERAPGALIVSLTIQEIRRDREWGYYLTGGLARFTGKTFSPDIKDPRYNDGPEHGNGINKLFMTTTVDNVLRWHEQETGSRKR
jgi:HEAT repeats